MLGSGECSIHRTFVDTVCPVISCCAANGSPAALSRLLFLPMTSHTVKHILAMHTSRVFSRHSFERDGRSTAISYTQSTLRSATFAGNCGGNNANLRRKIAELLSNRLFSRPFFRVAQFHVFSIPHEISYIPVHCFVYRNHPPAFSSQPCVIAQPTPVIPCAPPTVRNISTYLHLQLSVLKPLIV